MKSRWVEFLLIAALVLPPLPFALGNAHPAIAIAGLGLAAGAVRLADWRFERRFLAGALIVFFTLLALSLAPAAVESGPEIAAASLARLALAGISVYVFFYVAMGPGRHRAASLKLIWWAAVASAAFACVDFFYQLPAPDGAGPQFIWLETGVFRRAQGLFYEASTLGNLCAFFLVMTAIALVRRRGNRWVLMAGGAVFTAALFFSYSRSSLASLAIALIAFAWMERKRAPVRRAALTMGAAAAILIFAIAEFFPDYAAAFWLRISGSFGYALAGDTVFLSGRVESWQALWNFMVEHPWHLILGVGYKTLPYSDYIGRRVVADNMYLSTLVEVGAAGLVALIAMNWAILRAGFRAARSEDPEKSFYGTWIFCFWLGEAAQMMSADVLTFWRVLPVYFWVLAMAARESK